MSKEKDPLDGSDLIAALDSSLIPARVTFQNKTPCSMRVEIKNGGCKFWYREGGDDIDLKRDINLICDEIEHFHSRETQRCVHQVLAIMDLYHPPSGERGRMQAGYSAPDGYCIRQRNFVLAPRKEVMLETLTSRKLEDLFELIVVEN